MNEYELYFTDQIDKEMEWIHSDSFQLGSYIYMGMGRLNGRTVCLSVAYKIDYCLLKAVQFASEDANVRLHHINKVKVGHLQPEIRFDLPALNGSLASADSKSQDPVIKSQ